MSGRVTARAASDKGKKRKVDEITASAADPMPQHDGAPVPLTSSTIASMEKEMKSSTAHLNHLVTLLTFTEHHTSTSAMSGGEDGGEGEMIVLAYQALHRTLIHLFETSVIVNDSKQSPALYQLHAWLLQCVKRYVTLSVRLLIDDSEESAAITSHHAVHSLILVIQVAYLTHVIEARSYLALVIDAALTSTTKNSGSDGDGSKSWVKIFVDQYLARYDDLLTLTLRVVHKSLTAGTAIYSHESVLKMLLSLSPLTLREEYFFDLPNRNVAKLQTEMRSLFDSVYFHLLSHQYSVDNYRLILTSIDSKIVPSLINPLKLADFLIDSYNFNDTEIALLSLNALFLLINKYHLNYPFFYQKLLLLLKSRGCLALVRTHSDSKQFFKLLHLFLNSVYVPKQLITAYIKQLAQLALHAPTWAINPFIIIIFNLMRRHPATTEMKGTKEQNEKVIAKEAESLTEFLVQRQKQLTQPNAANDNDDSDSDGSIQEDANSSVEEGAADDLALDPENSSLWELKTLCSHYCPSVSALARVFFANNAPKADLPLDTQNGWTYESMIERELERRKNQKAPISHRKVETLFGDDPILSKFVNLEA